MVDVSENAIASLPRALAGLDARAQAVRVAQRARRPASGSVRGVGFPESPASGAEQARVAPPDLEQLARLEELWLSDNQIESLPASVAKLKRLRTVRLARNRLRFDEDDDDADEDDDDETTTTKTKKTSLSAFFGRVRRRARARVGRYPGIARVPVSWGAREARDARTTRASPPSPRRCSRDAFL